MRGIKNIMKIVQVNIIVSGITFKKVKIICIEKLLGTHLSHILSILWLWMLFSNDKCPHVLDHVVDVEICSA